MSTETPSRRAAEPTRRAAGPTRRERTRRRRGRAFLGAFAVVVGVLAVIGLGGAAVTTALGPRVTSTSWDPQAAVSASGSRLIITTTESLQEVSPDQVTVEPAADFTVDTSGRSVGVRFALPMWDDTTYTVTIRDVEGLGGGPAATITETLATPALEAYILRRGDGEDTIFRTDLAGDAAQPVFTDTHIEDFRATGSHLVVSTVDADERSHLVVTRLDGSGRRELPLPGDGLVTNLQSADRGNLVGYTYTDETVGQAGARENELFTASLLDDQADAEPTAVVRDGGDSRVDDWRFVPGTDSILMMTFDGALTLVTPDAVPVALGLAIAIDGIGRGAAVAIVQRPNGDLVTVDLATAEERPIPPTDPALGLTQTVLSLPDGSGGSLRVLSRMADDGFTLLGTTVNVVGVDGSARDIFDVPTDAAFVHTCVSPSGRYAAVTIAPDIVDNPYDPYMLPLPERLQTHIVEIADGHEVVALSGFDLSWCQNAPRL
ncbi:hypothetical protein [Microbacterium telephonicum]|uniref:SbsA Ig-like domain-containing protein n=1 Tax=Microbacterium telephonicum TaxID=1714841 RepID=A0A498CA35_9MICO|nr:hypothetical protein [Microbacterium telephonicum]RLK52099.1 hypothetical protein C7474_0025 [Microbacterium telephonicum]